jgi:hypothetical protein
MNNDPNKTEEENNIMKLSLEGEQDPNHYQLSPSFIVHAWETTTANHPPPLVSVPPPPPLERSRGTRILSTSSSPRPHIARLFEEIATCAMPGTN